MRLAVRTLRFRKGGFIATFIAVVFGTAIVLACGGLMETGIRSNVPPTRLAAAPLVVTAKQSHLRPGAEDATPLVEQVLIPSSTATLLRTVDGVQEIIGDVTFPAPVLTGSSVSSTGEGHSWSSARLAPYRLTSGHPPTSPGEVVLDTATARTTNARTGTRVTLLLAGAPKTYIVTGIADGPAGHTFFSSAEAAHLSGHPGSYSTLGITVAPGKDIATVKKSIEKAAATPSTPAAGSTTAGNTVGDLTPLTVRTGDDRGLAEHPEAATGREAVISIAGSFGGIATMTMMFVVASTLALSAQHREREFALLRSIGTTPGQVRRMILGESLLVSLPAVLAGLIPGWFLGRYLFDQLASHGVAPAALEFHQGLIPFAAGAGAAVWPPSAQP